MIDDPIGAPDAKGFDFLKTADDAGMLPPLDEIVAHFLAEGTASLPFHQNEQLEVTLLYTLNRRYSMVQRIRLSTPNAAWIGFIKTGDPNQIAKDYEFLSRFHQVFSMASSQFGVAKPVAHFPQYGAMITEEAPGRDLLTEAKARASFFPRRLALEQLESACRLCGEWLRVFHSATGIPDAVFALSRMREYNEERLMLLEAQQLLDFARADRERILAFFDSNADQVPQEDLAIAGVHGDFSPTNLLVSSGRVMVLDFSMYGEGSIYHDVAHLYHHLHALGAHPRFTTRTANALCRALLLGFDEALQPVRPLFRLFTVQHAICMLLEGLRVSEPAPLASRLLGKHLQRRRLAWLRQTCRSSVE